MARGLTTMEMIYSAVWADFILTKSLIHVSSDAMVFVYNLTLAGEAPQWGIHLNSFWGSGQAKPFFFGTNRDQITFNK